MTRFIFSVPTGSPVTSRIAYLQPSVSQLTMSDICFLLTYELEYLDASYKI